MSFTSPQIDREHLGPPGIDGYLHIVDIRRDEPTSAEQRLADRSPRIFAVRAALAKCHTQRESIRAGMAAGEAGCFITTPDDLRIQTLHGVYEVARYDRGELTVVSRTLTAISYQEAFETFLSGLTPALDHLSFLSNTPVVIDILDCRDEANYITIVSYRTPYGNARLSEGISDLSSPLFPVYALYQEALNSLSNFYRFLCFYKILEGIFDRLRLQLFKAARTQGIRLDTRQDRVPDESELGRFHPNYVGRSIHELYHGEFQAQYRNSVAHFALTDRSTPNPSAHRESNRFAGIVFLVEVCAREVIRNQEDYYGQFFQAGGVL
jgi:hypothetical protein